MIEKQLSQFTKYLAPRAKDSHKGMFGHVLIIGSDYGYMGATQMAAMAALRVGAGLVTIATRPEHTFHRWQPEIMCQGVRSAKDVKTLLAKATVIVVGPGMGQSTWAKQLLKLILKVKKPLIVDADALNLLALKPQKNANWILTPHLGEAGRLLKKNVADIANDHKYAVCEIQKKFGGIAILKSHHTLIKGADEKIFENTTGNPGMSSAGMGDILSGVLGGLVAQSIPLLDAAKLGVVVHGSAGDLAAKNGGERGMIATDLLPYLRQLMNV
jgi:NAD(P)H-hydrate epimerase